MLPESLPPTTIRLQSWSSVPAVLAAISVFIGSIAGAFVAVEIQSTPLMVAMMPLFLLSFAFAALSIVATFGYLAHERPLNSGKASLFGGEAFSFSTSPLFAKFIVREFVK